MHRLLERQVRRWLPDGAAPEIARLLQAVDEAYRASDDDQSLLERSLELSSAELHQANAELRARNEALARYQTRLRDLAVISAPDLDSMLSQIARVGSETLTVRRVSVWLCGDEGTSIRCQVLHDEGHTVPEAVGTKLKAEQFPAYFGAIAVCRSIAAHDARTDPRTSEFTTSYLEPLGITSMLDMPIRIHGQLAGIVCCEHTGPARTWSAEEEQFAASLADYVALAMVAAHRRTIEGQLRQAQKMEAIGVLAGGIAHEFNNLLTAILGYSDVLYRGAQVELRDDADKIRFAARRAASLTRQLLSFSDQQVVLPTIVDMNQIVAQVVGMLERIVGEDVTLRTEVAPHPALVMADPSQIEQALINLVVNAREAMPRGGTVTVRVEQTPATPGVGEPQVVLSVVDTGSGIDPAIRARIFEPFFTTKPRAEGSGLGLATVYAIARQAGGEISVLSEPQKGSAFRVTFPVATPSRLEEAVGPPPEPRQRVVLLVEDEALVRALANRILSFGGLRVIVAATGEEALEKAESAGPIDLLLTDVLMPGLSGGQVAERLVRLRPGLKVLFMSGYTAGELVGKGALAPGTAFLNKPFLPDALLHKVEGLLAEVARDAPGSESASAPC